MRRILLLAWIVALGSIASFGCAREPYVCILPLPPGERVSDVAPAPREKSDPARDLKLVASIGAVGCDLRTVPKTMTVDTLVDRLIRLADQEMYKSKNDGQVHVALARFGDDAAAEAS